MKCDEKLGTANGKKIDVKNFLKNPVDVLSTGFLFLSKLKINKRTAALLAYYY